MHIRPPDRLIRATPPTSRRSRRRRIVLGWMLGGSLLLHLLILLLIWWPRSHGQPDETAAAATDVSVVFAPSSGKQASTASAKPAPTPAPAVGNPQGVTAPPTPTPATDVPTQPPAPQPTPPAPAPAPPSPPEPQEEASLQPPQPEAAPTPPAPAPPTPPPPQAAPTPAPATPAVPPPPAPQAQKQPPTVMLDPSEEGELPMVPQFVMPQPPPPLPPLPTPAKPPPRPRSLAQSVPRSSSGFPMPQNWSLATGPASLLSQRGTDMASAPRGSKSDSEYKHVAGADPGEDWEAELHRWASDHAYYPEAAAENGEEGVAVIQATINRYGKVVNVELVERSGSAFLDSAWLGEWRNATVPHFPPGTPEDTTTIDYTIHYILVRSSRR